MKKKVLLFAVLVVLFVCAVSAQRPVTIVVGGEVLKTDVEPIIENGRTIVPLRQLFEAMDITVDYDNVTRSVTAKNGNKTVKFQIGSNIMTINGKTKMLDVPARIIGGRTMVPVRACAEAFDLDVEWNGNTRVVTVKKGTWLIKKRTEVNGDVTEYIYNQNNELIRTKNSDGTGNEYTYDKNGNITCIIMNDGSEFPYKEEYTYDQYGNMLTVKVGGSVKKYTYDSNGNAIYEEYKGEKIKHTYDARGNRIRTDYEDGSWEKRTYTSFCDVLTIENSYGNKETFKYDDNNNLIYTENDGGYGVFYHKYEYDSNGNMTYHEQNTSFGVYWKKYRYDSQNRVTWELDSRGFGYTYTYDGKGTAVVRDNCGSLYATIEYFFAEI